ncbi:MAG TPA: LLM class flavin-dependent oxidoreductase [Acidimicrobiia bacterium]|jgi:alkanesulfonate monooxygenase SsuD/methylene tetrahydromethanopterin reductase-like flavin-dependent oxidoreductase (luciferase family)
MNVGVSLRSGYDPATDPRTGARWMVERARAARAAGLASLFVGDHHATAPGVYYQNVVIVGRLLAEWDDHPAGALFLMPLWNPVLLAEQIGTLASIAAGRFVMQTAVGGGAEQFGAMGVPIRERAARFERGLATVRALLAGDEVDGARIAPVTPEPLEVWIGATAPPAIDRAARLGDAWLGNADGTPEAAREQAETYRERCAAHGRVPATVAIRRDVHVGADAADAERIAGPIVGGGYRGFHPDAFTYGGPEQVAARFREYAAMGYTDVIVRQLASEQADALASIERLAEVRELVADA